MKTLTIMGCGVIAAACATGKQADRAVDYPPYEYEPSTTVTTTEHAPERTDAPAHADSSTPSDPEGSAQARQTERTPAARGDARGASSHLSTVREGAADNTRNNERDRDGDALTPMDQGSSAADMTLTQQIRKAVVGESTLSFSAKNVKIISGDGKVTLRGAVKSERERKTIGDMASKIARAGNVDNQLEVAN
jgi:hypothetical protein